MRDLEGGGALIDDFPRRGVQEAPDLLAAQVIPDTRQSSRNRGLEAGIVTPLSKAQVVGAVVDLVQRDFDLRRCQARKRHFKQGISLGDAEQVGP